MSGYRGRFAPSPTGPLHFGSLVAAVASWLDARAAGGSWVVRMEDVDETRTVPGAAEAILATLEQFGMRSDAPILVQSRRKPAYERHLLGLRTAGLTYRCTCSRKEIADAGLVGPEGAVYPGTCRNRGLDWSLAGAERVRAPAGTLAFADRVQGRIEQCISTEIGDFVVKRRDLLHAYQLAVVVDDAEAGITDVVRGADLLLSTPRQIHLQTLLGFPTPRYLHVPIAANAAGEKLSKQTLAPAISGGDVARLLKAALLFLGQQPPAGGDARALLAAAAARWDPAAIPRRRAIHVKDGHGPDMGAVL